MFHRNILPEDNHSIASWVVADATALAALTPIVDDIGKVAVQLSPFAVYILEDESGPDWVALSAGGSVAASAVSVTDAGGYYVGTNVESILQEIGEILADLLAQVKQTIAIAISDEATDLTTGATKVTFHAPYDFDVAEVISAVSVAQTAGSILTFDVNINGSTMLSTKSTIDNNEKTSITAATPAVISNSAWNKGDEITIDIDQVGTAGAKGAKLYFVGKVAP